MELNARTPSENELIDVSGAQCREAVGVSRERTMPSRRPHTKTRHGCSTCKARKVRCDEEKPVCRNCTRGNRACQYPNQVISLPNALMNGSTSAKDQIFPLRDMDLLHHYTAYTYKYMTDVPQNYPVWQVIVPGLAFQYPFLLHGLLAASALHRHYTAEPSQKPNLMNLARYHQQHALTLYIPLIQSIDEENCHALFAFSVLLGVLCYSMLHEDQENEQPLAVRFMEVFDSLGGAVVVAVVATQWLHDGPLGPIMDPLAPMNRDFSILEPGMAAALEKLLECADQIHCDGSSKAGLDAQQRLEAYHNSIYAISTVLAPNNYENRKLSVVVSWSIIAGADYISLLRQRDALAVVILGHYGVALHQLHNTVWILEGLGKRLTDSVIGEVDECWHDVLTYAKAQVDQPVTPAQPKT